MVGFAVVAGLLTLELGALDEVVAFGGFNFWIGCEVKDDCLASTGFCGNISLTAGFSFITPALTTETLLAVSGFPKLLNPSTGTLLTGATRAIGALLGEGLL